MQSVYLYKPLWEGMINEDLVSLLEGEKQFLLEEHQKKVMTVFFKSLPTEKIEWHSLSNRIYVIKHSCILFFGLVLSIGFSQSFKLSSEIMSSKDIIAITLSAFLVYFLTNQLFNALENYWINKEFLSFQDETKSKITRIESKILQLKLFPKKPIDIIQLSKEYYQINLAKKTEKKLARSLHPNQLTQLQGRIRSISPGQKKMVLNNITIRLIMMKIKVVGGDTLEVVRFIEPFSFAKYSAFKTIIEIKKDVHIHFLDNWNELDAFDYIIKYIQNNHVEIPLRSIHLVSKLCERFGIMDCLSDCKIVLEKCKPIPY